MSRFRYEGVNWEGRKFYVAKPVLMIGQAVEANLPSRHPLDGTVASKTHDEINPNSDHRPKTGIIKRGIVRAIDIGIHDKLMGDLLAEVLKRLETVAYVLWQVPNHETHIHVSTNSSYDNDDRSVYVFSQSEVKEIKEALAEVRKLNSDFSGAVRESIKLVRKERELPLHSHDGQLTGGLGFGDTVKLTRP